MCIKAKVIHFVYPAATQASACWLVTRGDTSCLSPSSELVAVVARPRLYDFIPADVIIAQLIVMVPQGQRKKLQEMGEVASRRVSSVTRLLCLSRQQAAELG